jgi:hypothetical protein
MGAKQCGATVGWFCSAYVDARFLERAVGAAGVPLVPPLGSVGLTAVYLALRCRAADTVSVFVAGLDFAYGAGKTHCKGSPQHRRMLTQWGRLRQPFTPGIVVVKDKNGGITRSEPALIGYRDTFQSIFGHTPHLYDAGNCGLDLGIERKMVPTEKWIGEENSLVSPKAREPAVGGGAAQFLSAELRALEELKALLTGVLPPDPGRVRILLEDREYLYLHFPDGWELRMDEDFLKRIRSQIDLCIKRLYE